MQPHVDVEEGRYEVIDDGYDGVDAGGRVGRGLWGSGERGETFILHRKTHHTL